MRYDENFTSLLQDYKIEYVHEKDKERCLIDGMYLDEFLRQNQNKHEFIRKKHSDCYTELRPQSEEFYENHCYEQIQRNKHWILQL